MAAEQYIIRGGIEGRERLRLLSRVMRESTLTLLARVGLRPGMSCLDVGCGGGDVTLEIARIVGSGGRVVGWDVDEIKLDLARRDAEAAGIDHVAFQAVDIGQAETSPEYDVVYSRFLLTHLPDAPAIVAKFRQMLRPGGMLIVEDIDFAGHFSHPPSAGLARYVELYTKAVKRRGGDPSVGLRLPTLFLDAGFSDVRMHVTQPAGYEGEVKLVNPVTLENIAEALVADGLASRDEIDRLVAELYAEARNRRTVVSVARVVQAWGRWNRNEENGESGM